MVDQDSEFDGKTVKLHPLGGTESAFISLAEAFAKLGHEVIAMSKISKSIRYKGVQWKPLDHNINKCDLYIINRAPELSDKVPNNCKVLLWLHNPAKYLNKLKNFRRLILKDIKVICSGHYHYNTLPFWIKSRSIIIPLGITDDLFSLKTTPNKAPPPEVIFTSNPERGLEWLIDLWMNKIIKEVPNAKLKIYAGAKTYGGRHKNIIDNILSKIVNIKDSSIKIYEPVERNVLFSNIIKSRCMFYLGDPGETFCLSIAEAQALGLPCVVKPIGCLGERVKHKISGEVHINDDDFIRAAINILKNDEDWMFYRNNCLKFQRDLRWKNIAKEYIKILN